MPPRQLARPLFSCHFPGAPRAGEQPGVGQSSPGTSHAAATPQPISAVHFTSEAARAASQTTELWPRPPANGEKRRQRFAPPGSACDSERISEGEGRAARKPERPPIVGLLPSSDQLLARRLDLVTSLETTSCAPGTRDRQGDCSVPKYLRRLS